LRVYEIGTKKSHLLLIELKSQIWNFHLEVLLSDRVITALNKSHGKYKKFNPTGRNIIKTTDVFCYIATLN